MTPVEKIKDKLRKYPQARFEATARSITVLPDSEGGFRVSLVQDGNEYVVFFNGWHEKFLDQEEALNCFAFGLSAECRLKEFRRGKFAYKWVVEERTEDGWTADSETGRFFFPFWRGTEIRILQNSLIT
jgi:hypothetical protein